MVWRAQNPMPIYEYTCQSCQSEFELLIGPSSGKPGCPDCGSKKVQKKFSTFAAHQPSASMSACSEGGCPGSSGAPACGGGKCPYA